MVNVPKVSVPRAPLLYGLLPLIGAIIINRFYEICRDLHGVLFTISTISLIGACYGLRFFYKNSWVWSFFFLIACFGANLIFVSLRNPHTFESTEFPVEREAQLVLKIYNLTNRNINFNSTSGYAYIIQADKHLEALINQLIYFSINNSIDIFRGSTLNTTGILSTVHTNTSNFLDQKLILKGVYYKFLRAKVDFQVYPDNNYELWFRTMHDYMDQALTYNYKDPEKIFTCIYKAMILGNRSEITESYIQLFKNTGTAHLFSVSGLHMAILSYISWKLFRTIHIPSKISTCMVLLILFAYLMCIERPLSGQRALIMCGWIFLADTICRKQYSFVALINTALLILMLSPMSFWDLSFQFSYGVVASLLIYGLDLCQLLKHVYQPYKFVPKLQLSTWQKLKLNTIYKVMDAAGMTIAASIIAIPLGCLYFEIFNVYSIAYNIIIIPIASICILLGFISVFLDCLSLTKLCTVINTSATLLIQFICKILNCMAYCFTEPSVYQFKYPLLGASSIGIFFITIYYISKIVNIKYKTGAYIVIAPLFFSVLVCI